MPSSSGGGKNNKQQPNPAEKTHVFPHTLEPEDHMGPTILDPEGKITNQIPGSLKYAEYVKRNPVKFTIPQEYHYTKDDNDPFNQKQDAPLTSPLNDVHGQQLYAFSGSTTQVNREESIDKAYVMAYGLENAELNRVNNKKPSDSDAISATRYDASKELPPPISPIHPFTRLLDPSLAQSLNVFAYNRFHYPIADLEHRKSFRNLFFTRPECYIYCTEGKLAQQCELDDTLASSNSRFPHVLKLLSPVYVTGAIGPNREIRDNINYMISNRANGFSITEETLSVNESVGKSIEGYTVVEGMHMESHQGGTFSVSFDDTKYLEIYEYFRIWMNYIYKRKKGTFEPPFARYSYRNDYPKMFGDLSAKDKAFFLHPYDRALEYTASMFDFVTNEANDRIIYWCKYYGIYPVSVSISGLNSESAAPMTEKITVEVTFRYQYKLPCENKTLVEFNFNTGVTDLVGRVKNNIEFNHVTGHIMSNAYQKILDTSNDENPKQHSVPYQGGANMFVGTPYIVMGRSYREPTPNKTGKLTVHPFLRFMPINDKAISNVGNLGISPSTPLSNDVAIVGTDDDSSVASKISSDYDNLESKASSYARI